MKRHFFLLLVSFVALGMNRQTLRRTRQDDQHQWLAPSQARTDRCGICWGNDELKSLACDTRHRFHTDCIERWRKEQNTCPMCRAEIVDSAWCTCLKSIAKPSVILAVCTATFSGIRFFENTIAYLELAAPTLASQCAVCSSCALSAGSALIMGATLYSCIHAKAD